MMFTKDNIRAALAEFVAMVLFVFVGCGTAVSSQALLTFSPTLDNTFLTAVALAFGIGIAVLAYCIAPISGGHINPAVTFAFVLLGKMNVALGLLYLVAQLVGALLGAAIVWGCFDSDKLNDNGDPPFNVGANVLDPTVPVGSGFLIETMGTFLLVFTVMMTAVHKKNIAGNLAPIAIGWSVLLAHLVLVPITGCGINPARSFGPHMISIIAGIKIGVDGWWIYYTGPFVGAGAAALIAKFVFGLDEEEEEEESVEKFDDTLKEQAKGAAVPVPIKTEPESPLAETPAVTPLNVAESSTDSDFGDA